MTTMEMQNGPYPVPETGDTFDGNNVGIPAPDEYETGGGAKPGMSTKTWVFIGLLLIVMVVAVIVLYENSKKTTQTTQTTPVDTTGKGTKQRPINVNIIENRPGVPPVGPTPTPAPSTSGTTPPVSNPITVKVSQPPSTGGANFQDTSTGVPILSGTNSGAKVAQLQSSASTSIPGMSSALVAFDKQKARQGYVSGVTNTNVIQLASSTPFSQGESILDSKQGISIPGKSPAEVAYLQNQARRGILTPSEYYAAVQHG